MIPGETVNLRALERTDAGLLFRWFNDPTVTTFWGMPQPAFSTTRIDRQIESWFEDEIALQHPTCLIIETLDGEPVGLIVLGQYKQERRCAVISLMIGESRFQDAGLGSDALETVADVCFSSWNMHRLVLLSEADNARAHRVFEKCGFALEATLRQASFHDGGYHDLVQYAKLSTDVAGI